MAKKRILVLFEDGVIREESILYAFELGKRLELPVAFLMLVSDESNMAGAEDALTKKLSGPGEPAQPETTREIRFGDKATELLKYLAAGSTPAAIIWGSERGTIGKLGTGKPHHWLNKLSNLLPCSIVSPIPKNRDENQIRSEG